MIKLIVGIVLLILILISANYIFVEHFQQGPGYPNDSSSIRSFIESPDNFSFEDAKRFCPDILSGENTINRTLQVLDINEDNDKFNYDKSHALFLTYCNDSIQKNKKVPPLQKSCSEYDEDSLDLCLANGECQIKEENVEKCKNKCGGRYLEEGATFDTDICKTEQVAMEKQPCSFSNDPISCENNSIVIDGKQINHCIWNSEYDSCNFKPYDQNIGCSKYSDEESCNQDELCYYQGSCMGKYCALPGDGGQEASKLPDSACEIRNRIIDKDNRDEMFNTCSNYDNEFDCENDFCSWDRQNSFCNFNLETYCENKSNEYCDSEPGCEFIDVTHPVCRERV